MNNGPKRIMQSVGDIQKRITNAVLRVVIILIILVVESEIISSNCATSADSTDIKLPVCLVSKYDASISIKDFVASILISCWAL